MKTVTQVGPEIPVPVVSLPPPTLQAAASHMLQQHQTWPCWWLQIKKGRVRRSHSVTVG